MRKRFLTLALTLLSVGCRDAPTGVARCGVGLPRVLWCTPSDSSVTFTPHDPGANAERTSIYFVTSLNRLKKVRASDGKVLWDVSAGPPSQGLPTWNAVVSADVVVTEDGNLSAYDTTSGTLRWTFAAPWPDIAGYTSLTASDSTVFTGSYQGRLYALNARNGVPRWVADLTEGDPTVSTLYPVYANGTVYVCSLNSVTGKLWSVDAVTGTPNWSHRFDAEVPQSQRAVCFGDPAVTQDLVIQPESDGRVFAFERASGAIRWIAPRVHVLPTESLTTGSWEDMRWAAAFGDNIVVCSTTSHTKVVSLDPATGQERWRNADIDGAPFSHPAIDDRFMYLSYGWTFAVYDVVTGKMVWRDPPTDDGPESLFYGKPVVGTDRIFVAGRHGSYALSK